MISSVSTPSANSLVLANTLANNYSMFRRCLSNQSNTWAFILAINFAAGANNTVDIATHHQVLLNRENHQPDLLSIHAEKVSARQNLQGLPNLEGFIGVVILRVNEESMRWRIKAAK